MTSPSAVELLHSENSLSPSISLNEPDSLAKNFSSSSGTDSKQLHPQSDVSSAVSKSKPIKKRPIPNIPVLERKGTLSLLDRPVPQSEKTQSADIDYSEFNSTTQNHSAWSNFNNQSISFLDPQEPTPSTLFYFKTFDLRRPSIADLANPQIGGVEVTVDQRNVKDNSQPESDAQDPYADTELNLQPGRAPSFSSLAVPKPESEKSGFGTWDGVFVSCMLNIFGVIMYLRLGWVVGFAGIGYSVVVILLSTVVTLTTTLSMSAIATNGEISGGGAYFLISRSLGPEFGAAIGILFSIGLSVAIALYTVGFAEALVNILLENGSIDASDSLNYIRLIGTCLLILILLMALGGPSWIIKLQVILFGVIVISILAFLLGTIITSPSKVETIPPDGYTSYDSKVISLSFGPKFTTEVPFFTVFAVYLPAATGILAGANLSGDLKNPSEAIPKGTLTAIFVSTITYIGLAIILGFTVAAETLQQDFLIMAKIAGVLNFIVFAGIFLATFSSALASIIGAPRIFQAVCRDKLFKGKFWVIFGKGVGKGDDPRNGYFLAFFIALPCVLIGELNFIAPIISNFFMITYGLINWACFSSEISKSPAWRPTFRYFNKYTSLFGTLLCFSIMFAMEYITALITVFLAFLIYKFIDHTNPTVEFGSWGSAYKHIQTIKSLLGSRGSRNDTKTFRPHYLVLTGEPKIRPHMLNFLSQLSKGYGLVLAGNVIIGNVDQYSSTAAKRQRDQEALFSENRIKAFYNEIICQDYRLGVQSLVQLAGFSTMSVNTVVTGFKKDWYTASTPQVETYVNTIRDCLHLRRGTMVCRNIGNINYSLPEGPVGFVDVWWLFDDGGLTILLPYLLTKKKYWKKIKLRVYTVAGDNSGVSTEALAMVSLLKKLRLWDTCELIPVGGGLESPAKTTIANFSQLGILPEQSDPLYDRTMKQLRLSELIQEYSSDSELLFMSLPFPRPNYPAKLYMSWLEVLSRKMPPTVFLRGNQENVLSFYI